MSLFTSERQIIVDTEVQLGLLRWSSGKESACNAGDPGLVPVSGRSPGEGNGNPLQYSCLENSMDRGTLAGYSPQGCKELNMTEQLTGEGNGNPLQCSCLENHRDGGAWWAAVYGVTQSWTRLKRLSSSSSRTTNTHTHKVQSHKRYPTYQKLGRFGESSEYRLN